MESRDQADEEGQGREEGALWARGRAWAKTVQEEELACWPERLALGAVLSPRR